MRSSSVRYLAKEGIRNVWSNRLMSFASIAVLAACLMMVGFATLFAMNLDSMVGYIERQSTIEVFIRDDATNAEVEELGSQLERIDSVDSVTYISKEQALEDYSEQLGNETLLENLGDDNFLPASYRISASDLSEIDTIIQTAERSPAYESHRAPTNVATTITNLKNTITWLGIAIVIALVIVSLVVISNTIRATVFARRREIGIMKQVGATNNFIRIPFLFEGICLGVVAAVVAFLVIWLGYESILNALMNNASALLQSMYQSIIPFSSIWWGIALAFLGGGIITGAAGSVISLRTHLKV